MIRAIWRFTAILACASVVCYGQGNVFDRVRYNGGSFESKVDPKDWHNRLTVTPDTITLDFKDGKKLEIPPKAVTSLSYGQEAHRRVGTMIALAILVAPVALFGLLHKTRLHYIGIQYRTPDDKTAGILLQGDKDNYRAILVALQGVANVPVAVSEKDREFLPVSVRADVTKNTEQATTQQNTTGPEGAAIIAEPSKVSGSVNVSSNPTGADVSVDGAFVGNCPAKLKLAPGKHVIAVTMTGYKEWSRELNVQGDSEVQLSANLDKQ